MKYTTVLFDLDGTLTESGIGIRRCFDHALNKLFPEKIWDESLFKGIVGPPLTYSFENFFGLDKEMSERAVKLYRERYSTVGLYENKLYDGVYDLLKELKGKGYFVALATSKPKVFAEKILKHFEISEFFDFVGGATIDGSISSKTEVITYVLENISEKNKENIVMIGDKSHDLIGALNKGIDAIGVTYGYGDFEELSACKNIAIVSSAKEISDVLKKL